LVKNWSIIWNGLFDERLDESIERMRARLMETSDDFFLLTSDCVDVRGFCELLFWGHGSEGPVLVRIPKYRPVFFIHADVSLPANFEAERRRLEMHSFDGRAVDGLYFPSLVAYYEGRRRLAEAKIRTWESDIRPEERFLMERFIHGSAKLRGKVLIKDRYKEFINPEFKPSEWHPRLSVVSLDIETGVNSTLYSVAMDYNAELRDTGNPSKDAGRIRVVGLLDTRLSKLGGRSERFQLDEGEAPVRLDYLPTETLLLEFLVERIRELDPDLIIGWHVVGFDLAFLLKRSRQLNFPLRIGRDKSVPRLIEQQGSLPIVDLGGRLIVDGPPLLRGASIRFSDWRLDTAAREVLGRGKSIPDLGRVTEIERRFRDDKEALARYNLDDAILVTEIFEKTGVLKLMISRSLITGLQPDQIHRSVAAFDRFFLPRLHRKGYVAPNRNDVHAKAPTPGAMVFSGGFGLFEEVAVLDFKSLYPSLIQTFHIDPYSLLRAAEDPLTTPVGIDFSGSEHILPDYIGRLMQQREAARKAKDFSLAYAVKILMNSMYGVMGTAGCRFYDIKLPTAITGIGRWVLESTAKQLRNWGYKVLYGDTDSVFVQLKEDERINADVAGRDLALRVDKHYRETIQANFGIPSFLELEFEKRYLKLFLPAMRTNEGEAAVKRYAGLLPDGNLDIKGMEFVRSDSTPLARDFQYELFRRYFNGEALAPWIRDVVRRLRNGEFDEKLVYKRRLSRRVVDYKSPPPHVRAAKLLDPDGSKNIRRVEYLITPRGPVPLELRPREIDYNHYIEKQLRSLADDILIHNGESFDAILGGKQLELWKQI